MTEQNTSMQWTEELVKLAIRHISGEKFDDALHKTNNGMLDLRKLPLIETLRPDGVRLSNIDFGGMRSQGRLIFANSKLDNCVFDGSRINWGDYRSEFEKLSFVNAKLAGSGFHSTYNRCYFSYADLSGCIGNGPHFYDCIFDFANFNNAIIRNCVFEECRFHGVLNGAILGGDSGVMRVCDLETVSLIDCTFNNFIFDNCRFSDKTLVFHNWKEVLSEIESSLKSIRSPKLIRAVTLWIETWKERLDLSKDQIVDCNDLVHFEGEEIGKRIFQLFLLKK